MTTKTWFWPSLEELTNNITLPIGYRLEIATSKDLAGLVLTLRGWFPEIQVGSEQCHLDPEYYLSAAYLADAEQTRNRALLPIIGKFGDSPAFFISLEKQDGALSILSRIGAIAPEHRGSGLALLGPHILETVGKLMNAGLVYYFATLMIIHQQIAAERSGFHLVGILPSADRILAPDGTTVRVTEALYAKVLPTNEPLAQLSPKALTPQTSALWQSLFGQQSSPK